MHRTNLPFSFILIHANLPFYTLKQHAHLPFSFILKHANLPFLTLINMLTYLFGFLKY